MSTAIENGENKKGKIYFKSIFDKYDINNNGTIELNELCNLLKDDNDVSQQLVQKLFKYSDADGDKRINFDEFYKMVHDEKFTILFNRYLNNYMKFIVPPRKFYPLSTDGRIATDGGSTFVPTARSYGETVTDAAYEKRYTCCPPPITMFLFSIIQLICYVIDQSTKPPSEGEDEGAAAKIFIYDPYRRQECWRILTYMFVHIGWGHIIINVFVQLALGLPLELAHRWWRILIVYSLGVITGSLFTSLTNPSVYLAGASGGVYSIITAHIASIIMNWKDMEYPLLNLLFILLLILSDVSSTIYYIYHNNINGNIGYAAHFGGGIAGLLVGIWVLKNVDPTKKEKYIWWIAFGVYIVLIFSLVCVNIFWTTHFPGTRW